ncbi:MAG: NADH:flavin oxidoreductase [Alphaproteobacteria bacterium]|nr:MAG: NADH:flavin oxidoreductase [Alphaproteobacteria bacterium]RPJ79715.1 MAG: NADH:flavin oxidoreductase [Alphaproteobacteria bacterium]
MKSVFSDAEIAGVKLKNRIIRSATHEGMADKNGSPTEMLMKKYELLARGEVGAIITGYAGVQQDGKCSFHNSLMIDNDSHIKSFQEMTRRVHEHHTAIFLQVAHCGRQTRSKKTGFPTVAPSPIRDNMYSEEIPHALSEAEINEIIENFVLAIERTKTAGFDGVQLHAAHGYLLSSFLSPHMNKRNDKWGANTENRFRIVGEILRQARARVGEFPILAKINAYEKSKDGIKIDEAVKISRYLEQAGCDGIEVSCGIAEEGFVTTRGNFPFEMIATNNFKMEKIPRLLYPLVGLVIKRTMASPEPHFLYNLDHAEEIKKNVNIPVIVVGGIRKLEDIKNIIENERCDFVSMSRPFIIEPNLVKKFKEARQSESKCINCNYCSVGSEKHPLKCYCGTIAQKDTNR